MAYLYVLPAFAVYAAFVLVPLGHTIWLSLHQWDGLTPKTWVGLDNYKQLVRDPILRDAFKHAFVLIGFYAVIPVTLGLVLVAALSRASVRGQAGFRTVLFLPQVIPLVVVAVIWRMIYAPLDGPLNRALEGVGLGALARPWLGDFGLALPAVGLVGTWVMIGLTLVLFMAGVQKIPQIPFHLVPVHCAHRAFRSISSASRGSSRNLARARDMALLTVPSGQSSKSATCASDRSSKTLSTSTARWRRVNDPSASRTAMRAATSAATSLCAGPSGTAAEACSPRHRRRHQVAHVFTITRRT